MGCLFYEICAMKLPFDTILEAVDKEPKEINQDYSSELKKIIKLMLRKEESD